MDPQFLQFEMYAIEIMSLLLFLVGLVFLVMTCWESLRRWSIDVGLHLLLLGFVVLQIPFLWVPEKNSPALLVILGAGVVSCSMLAWRAHAESEGAPALEMHWGGFGGGLQGMHIRPQFFLGVLALAGAGFWLTAAHAAMTTPRGQTAAATNDKTGKGERKIGEDKPSDHGTSPKPLQIELKNLTVNPIDLRLSKSGPLEIGPIKVDPIVVPQVPLGPLKVDVEPIRTRPVKISPLVVSPVTIEPVDVNPVSVESIEVRAIEVQPVSVKVNPLTVEPIEVKPIVPVCPPGTVPTWWQESTKPMKKINATVTTR